jgi:cytochrome bd-type quinol oxidase subunit 2
MKKFARNNDQGTERLDLPDALSHVLDECRMVLPGIQALFGFQMVAVFNSSFRETLTGAEQKIHLAAIILVVLAIAMVMAPASLHREAEPKVASDRFLRVATRLLLAAMFPLAAGICLDLYLVANVICRDRAVSAAIAVVLFAILAGLWFLYPPLYRSGNKQRAGGSGAHGGKEIP